MKKKYREFLLWSFLLAVCFWAGYLRGYLPLSLSQSLFVKGSIKVLNATPFDFSADFVRTLEEELDQKVEIEKAKNWEEVQVKLISRPGYHLLFAPTHWAKDLKREELLVTLNALQKKIEKNISPDFISLEGRSLYSLPLFWTTTDFYVGNDSVLGATLRESIANKALVGLRLFPDGDLIVNHLRDWAKLTVKDPLQPKEIVLLDFKNSKIVPEKNVIYEVPHLMTVENAKKLPDDHDRALLLFGAIIPKNSPNRKFSLKIIDRLMDPSVQSLFLSQVPLATTLKDSETSLLPKEQKASELRNLSLHELIIPEGRSTDGLKDLKQKFQLDF